MYTMSKYLIPVTKQIAGIDLCQQEITGIDVFSIAMNSPRRRGAIYLLTCVFTRSKFYQGWMISMRQVYASREQNESRSVLCQ